MATDETFGTWLRQRRRVLDLTQQELAERVGCSPVTIRKFEADERRPSKQLAELLAFHLQVPPAEQEQFITFARTENANHPAASSSPLPPFPPSSPINNLPASLSSFIGREAEITAVSHLLCQPATRLLTLTGPGGTGKTRLALETACRLQQNQATLFPDGIFFVNLASLTDPEMVIPVIAATLQIKESGTQKLAVTLTTFLQSKRLLLLLDNFEQIAEAGQQLLTLLSTAAGLKLLVTSRTVLHLYGEYEYPVPPLALPNLTCLPEPAELAQTAAITLFVERACAVKSGFALTAENATTIAEICVRLDGLPLAIELAAAHSKLFPPVALLHQLGHRLDFLASQNRHMTDRQRTLRGAIDWSYNLLDKAGKQLFAILGVFVGAFSLRAATSVLSTQPLAFSQQVSTTNNWGLGTDRQVLNILSTLIDQSMVQPVETAESTPRFRLLLTLREYALEQLSQHNELENTQARHASYYLSLAEQARLHFYGPEQIAWLQQLEADHDNLRAAIRWSLQHHPETALRLTSTLSEFWRIHGHFSEGRDWLAAALTQAHTVSRWLQAAVLTGAGVLAYAQGDYAQAHIYLADALALYQTLEDETGIAVVFMHLGRMAWSEEKYDLAWQYGQQALDLERELGNQINIGMILNNLGLAAHYQHKLDIARSLFEESLAVARQVGNKVNIATALTNLGNIEQQSGHYEKAKALFEESLNILRELGYKQNIAIVLGNLGNTGLKIDDLEMAEARYKESLEIRRQLGARIGETHPLHGLGVIARRRGDYALALNYFEQSLIIWQESNRIRDIPSLLEVIAGLLADIHHPVEAARLMGASEMIREQHLASPQSPHSQESYQKTITTIREQLPAEAVATAWQNGRNLPLEEAVVFARQMTHVLEQPATATTKSAVSLPPRFVEESLIAVGGMGEVYRGRDTTTNQPVVIKRLKPELMLENPEMVARFTREGELLRQLNHPNIVKMITALQENGRYHLIMEYVPGGSLRDLLNEQSQLPVKQVISLALELADALTRAHHLNIIHRDLKPENVLLATDGSPRLTDFGISYQPQSQTRLTQPGVVLGTTAYLSPEGCLGQELDVRSDIWAFGVLLYEMLTGKHPFETSNFATTLLAILRQPAPDLSQFRRDIPTSLANLIDKMLVKERNGRVATMRQIAAELETIQAGSIHSSKLGF